MIQVGLRAAVHALVLGYTICEFIAGVLGYFFPPPELSVVYIF